MVVIFLAKEQIGQQWSHVTAAEKAKAAKKNEVPKMDDNADPSKGLMDMMKKMYDEKTNTTLILFFDKFVLIF